MLRVMTERFPEETAAHNDLAYLNLLLNENVEASAQTAAQLTKANPGMLAHRTSLALALLRLKRPAEAVKLYAGVNLDWSKVMPGWQAVHAAVLAANNEMDAAKKLAQQIPVKGLRPEERFLIQPLLLNSPAPPG